MVASVHLYGSETFVIYRLSPEFQQRLDQQQREPREISSQTIEPPAEKMEML